LWGGLAALSWSRNKLRELGELEEAQQPSIPNSTYPGESNGMISGSQFEAVVTVDGLPLYETKEEADRVAIEIGCSGCHVHNISGRDLYMPCETHTETQDRLLKDVR
jgi:hypothetical protein